VQKSSPPKPSNAVSKPYVRTPRERKSVTAYRDYLDTKGAPRIKAELRDGSAHLSIDHPEIGVGQIVLMEALGTKDLDFYSVFLGQLADVGRIGRTADESGLNFMLSVVKGVEPNDQLEAMLAAQMAAVHNASMTFARRLTHIENIPQQDSASRAFNQLTRTFAAQLEALKRYRTGGQQNVTVKHVHVHDGGQAIVGNVSHGGAGDGKN
jgi:hypothetical protein